MEKRYSEERRQIQQNRPVLASVKRVYGGAFTGRDTRLNERENGAVQGLIIASDSFQQVDGKHVSAHYKRLHTEAAKVVLLVRGVMNHDVSLYVKQFSSVLLNPKTTLRWDARSNTCQDFADHLLRDPKFGGLMPKLPKAFVNDETVRANPEYPVPRYLVSFGISIDTPIALLRPQPRSVVWRFYHGIRDDCDLIEYAERINDKQASIPQHLQRVSILGATQPTEGDNVDDMIDSLFMLPRDTLSILQTHLLRRYEKYSSPEGFALSKREWVKNRLQILQQLDLFGSLCGAWGSAWLAEFLENPAGLQSEACWPDAVTYGTLHVSESVPAIGPRFWGFYYVTGREREWWKRELYYTYSKIRGRIPP